MRRRHPIRPVRLLAGLLIATMCSLSCDRESPNVVTLAGGPELFLWSDEAVIEASGFPAKYAPPSRFLPDDASLVSLAPETQHWLGKASLVKPADFRTTKSLPNSFHSTVVEVVGPDRINVKYENDLIRLKLQGIKRPDEDSARTLEAIRVIRSKLLGQEALVSIQAAGLHPLEARVYSHRGADVSASILFDGLADPEAEGANANFYKQVAKAGNP